MPKPVTIPEPINLFRRLAGVGTILLGAFALFYCVSYIGEVWNTPQRTLVISVTIASVLIMSIGAVIGFPELLPKKIVAASIFFFGILTMFIGLSTLVWVGYNLFFAQRNELPNGNLRFPIMAICVGFGMAAKSYSKLKSQGD